MRKLIFALPTLALLASTSAHAQFFIQLKPVTDASTLNCANFAKQPDKTWQALNTTAFSLGIIHGILPPLRPIKSGSFIYNNVDLYAQLNYQCGNSTSAVVTTKY